MAVTDIYSGGVRATAITAITAAVNARITTNSDGVQVLDTDSLVKYLQDQFRLLSDGTTTPGTGSYEATAIVSPATPSSVAAAARAVNVGALVSALNDQIRLERWQQRTDFPKAADMSDSAIASAVKSGFAQLKTLADNITEHYRNASSKVYDIVWAYYIEGGFDDKIPTGIQRLIDTRFYLHTHLTATGWDEESAPGPASLSLDVDQNDTVSVTLPAAPAGRNITRYRLYRSNSSNTGAAWQFVKEGAISTSTTTAVTDDVKAESLGEVLPTTTWTTPPANLQGIVAMPNGVIAGFHDNTLDFCEPYKPYAFPEEYRIPLDYPIVGLGVFGQTLFVGTRGNPYLVSGADSASMSAQKLQSNQACVSRRSIQTVPGGVVYASPDGLFLATPSGVSDIPITVKHFTRKDWQALTPSSIFAAVHEGTYYFFYNNGTRGCYALDLQTGKLTTINLTSPSLTPTAAYVDPISDGLYVASGTTITQLMGGGTNRTAIWRSPKVMLHKQEGFAWIAVESDFGASVTARIYGDGALVHTATFSTLTPQRMPPGRYKQWEVEIEATVNVTAVILASSTDELKSA